MGTVIDPEDTETAVLHDLVDFSGRAVLEVGCGDGRMTWRYAESTASVLGIDPDEPSIERALASTPKSLRHRVTFRVADITRSRLPRDAFDVAVMSHSLCCIEPKGVVRALERIHRSLRPDGLLLDVHPQPQKILIEVWQETRSRVVATLDQEDDIRDIRLARARMRTVLGRRLFVTERRRNFDMLQHHPSVDHWLRWRARRGRDPLPDHIPAAARNALANGGGELVLRERIRATLLRRLPDG